MSNFRKPCLAQFLGKNKRCPFSAQVSCQAQFAVCSRCLLLTFSILHALRQPFKPVLPRESGFYLTRSVPFSFSSPAPEINRSFFTGSALDLLLPQGPGSDWSSRLKTGWKICDFSPLVLIMPSPLLGCGCSIYNLVWFIAQEKLTHFLGQFSIANTILVSV